jgi:capsular polysaccharide biosynthesis protein
MFVHMEDWCSRHRAPFHELASFGAQAFAHQPLSGPVSQATVYGRSQVFCARVPDPIFFGKSGFIWTRDGHVIAHGLTHKHYDLAQIVSEELAAFAPQRGAPGPRMEEECVFFGGSTNFGHFMFQHMTKLHAVRQIPAARDLPLAVYRNVPRRYLEFLDLAAYPESRRIYVDHDRPVAFANAWVPSTAFYRGHYNDREAYIYPDAVFGLRNMILDRTRIAGDRPRIYVTRNNAQWRRIVNEDEVLAVLDGFGFKVVRLEEMSAAEQVELVSQAEIIVMTTGAASPITSFAPTDCIVLELTNRHLVGTFGSVAFSHILGQILDRIVGEDVPSAALHGRPMIDMDFRVPIASLTTALAAASDLSSRRRLEAEKRQLQVRQAGSAPGLDAA